MPETESELSREIKDIILKRLINAPSEAKAFFPEILNRPDVRWIELYGKDNTFAVIFVDSEEQERADLLRAKGVHPFPGFITTRTDLQAAFRVDNSRFITLDNITVKNMFALCVGRDSSIAVSKLALDLVDEKNDSYEYTIQLAYVIAFGDELGPSNAAQTFQDLVSRSVESWRETN